MKRKLLTLILVLASIAIFAQKNQVTSMKLDGTVITEAPVLKDRAAAPDFTATFTDGSTFNLYNFLNAGPINHYVLLDLFFVS